MSIEIAMTNLAAALNRHADVLEVTNAITSGTGAPVTPKTAPKADAPKKPTAAEVKKAKAKEEAAAKAKADAEATALLEDDSPAITKDMLTALVKDCIKLGKQDEAIAVIKDKGYPKLSAVPEAEYPEVLAGLTAVKG